MNDGVSVARTAPDRVTVTYDRDGVLWSLPLQVRPGSARDIQDARNALVARHRDAQQDLPVEERNPDPIHWWELLAEEPAAVNGATAPETWLASLADVRKTWIDMIWRPFLPAGYVTIVAGPPGVGKSLALLSIASRMTLGYDLPGEEDPDHDPANVAWLSLEEGAGPILRPRFEAAGAELSRIQIIVDEEHCRLDDPVLLARLAALLATDVRLVVIDSLAAWTYADTNKGEAMRAVLTPLVKLMEAAPHCSLAIISHFRKLGATSALDRLAGSAQGGATVRSVVAVTKRSEAGHMRHYWAHAKHNLSAPGETQTFRTEGRDIDISGRTANIGMAIWGDPEPDLSADDLAQMDARPADPEKDTRDHDDAQALLDALVQALEADHKPGLRSTGAVSVEWIQIVADAVERPSGRPKDRAWWSRVLKAVGVDTPRRGRGYDKRRFPETRGGGPVQFRWEKDIRAAHEAMETADEAARAATCRVGAHQDRWIHGHHNVWALQGDRETHGRAIRESHGAPVVALPVSAWGNTEPRSPLHDTGTCCRGV